MGHSGLFGWAQTQSFLCSMPFIYTPVSRKTGRIHYLYSFVHVVLRRLYEGRFVRYCSHSGPQLKHSCGNFLTREGSPGSDLSDNLWVLRLRLDNSFENLGKGSDLSDKVDEHRIIEGLCGNRMRPSVDSVDTVEYSD